jgi:hypothetical protein
MRVVRAKLAKAPPTEVQEAPKKPQSSAAAKPAKKDPVVEAYSDPDYVPNNWDDEPPQTKGKKKGAQAASAAAASAPAPSAASVGLLDPQSLLSTVTRAFGNASTLTLNGVCLALASAHGGATWKTLAGSKLSLKQFLAQHKETFDVQVDQAHNEVHITLKTRGPAAAAPQQQQAQPKQQQQQGGGGGGRGGGRGRSQKPQQATNKN